MHISHPHVLSRQLVFLHLRLIRDEKCEVNVNKNRRTATADFRLNVRTAVCTSSNTSVTVISHTLACGELERYFSKCVSSESIEHYVCLKFQIHV